MPRKAFLADVTSTSEQALSNILDVKRGDDDGDVNFVFVPTTGASIAIGVLALDVSGYPSENNFMIFTKSPDIPPKVNKTLEAIARSSTGMRIPELVQTVSQRLTKVLASGSQEDPLSIDDDSDVQMLDGLDKAEEDSGEEFDGGFDSEDDDFGYSQSVDPGTVLSRSSPAVATELNRRIKQDLRAVKSAGFKVGILNGLRADSQISVLSMSIQVAKLGLSEEALQAWDLEPNQYIVLLVRYTGGYKTFDVVISEPPKSLDIAFRIGVCNKYKPTLSEAFAAFTETCKYGDKPADDHKDQEGSTKSSGFGSIFISSSLNEFINEQFIRLLKIRVSTGLGWDGAKHFYNDRQGRGSVEDSSLPAHYHNKSKPKRKSAAGIMYADHLDEGTAVPSFPLIAAQFSLLYLVRCTEFCLVCHDRIEGDFEALKPYVCDQPLCLYQYMSLGFGPSVEHEILTQPYVVDLLVSFCYTAAFCQRIREYPIGMSLSVPPVAKLVTKPRSGRFASVAPSDNIVFSNAPQLVSGIEVKFDQGRQEIIFENPKSCPVRHGEWIVITAGSLVFHYRVENISLFPVVQLSSTAVIPQASPYISKANGKSTTSLATPATTPPPPALVPAQVVIYDQNFDDMSDANKGETIIVLLQTLPSITELRNFLLKQSRTSEPNLRAWKERVSPAALGLLRWIIASNRSCIIQVDKCPGQEDNDSSCAKFRLDQKCSNVPDNWLQFRFAQGSPDKEQRFLNSLRVEQGKFDPKYPTMFAFHGSGLQNWHSIIRHGLDFKETINGRAYGHGVYHAMDQDTSAAYAQIGTVSWPASDLQITSAMSLNEIVNCPNQFTSKSPYIVVQHIDWIQARYLFVQTNNVRNSSTAYDTKKGLDSAPHLSQSTIMEQDPQYTAVTTLKKPVGIPHCAISVSRAFRAHTDAFQLTSKRRKVSRSGTIVVDVDDIVISDEEEIDDVNFLFSDDEASANNGNDMTTEKLPDLEMNEKYGRSFLKSIDRFGKTKTKSPAKPMTDFIPGTLDQASLPMLQAPAYATSSATMRINRDLKDLLKLQNRTPLHELGWYLNPELVSNVYQWIVELHSFDSELPLAKDMKAANMTSIVLEIRFPKEYPHSPPFIRVIRPRFLPFTQGGGGHVTAGGAMCMELLTNSGWSSVSSMEGVLLQVRLAIMNLEPSPARLEKQGRLPQQDYGAIEAMEAYKRACRTHGWEIPKDFQEFA